MRHFIGVSRGEWTLKVFGSLVDQSTVIAIVTTVLTFLATATSLVSAMAARKAVSASERSASAAEQSNHRARTPQLTIQVVLPIPADTTIALYRVRNDGPEALDAVVIQRPLTDDGVIYGVGSTEPDFVDETDLGPMSLGERKLLKLSVGPATELPEFRVVIRGSVRGEHWDVVRVLPSPRADRI